MTFRPVGGDGCSSSILRSTSRSDLSMWSSSSSSSLSQVWNSNDDQQPPSMLFYNSLLHRCTIRSLSRCDKGDGWNRRSFSSTTPSSSSSVSTTPTTIYTTTGRTTTSSSSDATTTPNHPTTVPTFHRLGIGMGQWNAIVSTDMDPTPTMIMGTTEEDEEEENVKQTKDDTTMTLSSPSSPSSPTSPYAQMQQLMYQRIIETALFPLHHHHPSPHATSQSSISNTIEIGFQSDQDIAFVQAYRSIVQERLLQIQSPPLGEMDTTTTTTAAETNQSPVTTDPSVFSSSSPLLPLPPIHVLWRIGYREIPPVILPTPMADTIGDDDSIAKSRTETTSPKTVTNTSIDPDAPDTSLSFLKEDPIYQQEYDTYERRRQQRQSSPFRTHAEDVIVPPDVTTARSIMTQPSKTIVRPGQLIHNISPEYIQHVLLGKSTNRTAVTTNDTTVTASQNVEVQYESLAPLLQLKQDYPEAIRLIILLQNPETQYARYERGQRNLHPKIVGTTISDYLESLLYQSFTTLQSICDDGPKGDCHPSRWIDGYGVVSNGLSLYEGHPMHVSYRAIGQAAQRVYHNQVVGAKSNVITTNTNDHLPPSPKFCAIQLPANALENNGIAVATKIQQMKQEDIMRCRSDQSTSPPSYLTNLNVIAMRPLKCFSDGGTGANATHPSTRKFRKHNNDDMISSLMIQSAQFPFTLVDYTVTQNMNRQEVSMFTNEMSQPPLAYNASYQRAVQLFDGHEIIERQEERRYAAKKAQDKMKKTEPLNVLLDTVLSDNQGGGSYGTDYLSDEERETLHGCQILLQMIQNCHEVLQNARCIQIHEMLLSQYVLPILSNQFASLDDQTSRTLEAYFTIYGPTMQYYVAHNTRQLLLHGETTTTGANGIDNGNHSNNPQNENTVALSSPRYNHVPKTKRLQEFGLELLLQQQIKVFRPPIHEGVDDLTLLDPKNETSDIVNDLTTNSSMTTTTTTTSNCNSSNKNTSVSLVNVFDTVMVGMATIEEVLDTMNIIQTYENETVSPHTNEKHDAI